MAFIDFYLVLAAAALAVLYVIAVVLTETLRPVQEWIGKRTGMCDAGQSEFVRRYALKLASRRRKDRLTTAAQLGALNDNTAVPCLLKAIDRNGRDPVLVEALVRTLEKVGDERAIDTLKILSKGRNQSLMQAAKAAIAAIEPHGTLLRSASPSVDQSNLLKPINPTDSGVTRELLIPSNTFVDSD